ncbi:MAG: hypothetical protein GXO62_00495 [Epsilonproteobacteria bacterium]|nr:hypothetical protein [Campylobacterota bacterium]
MRFIRAYVEIEFDEYTKELQDEFDKLAAEMEDPIGQFIKLKKARGETKETDPVLLELLIALHRKVDELTALVKNEKKEYLPLKYKSETEGVGFEGFKIKDKLLSPLKKYYGRLKLPVFPERVVPIIFEALSADEAKIIHMHERDVKDYNAFITARERAIIREMKAKK